ncbi:hypothetical protein C1701_23970 [Actinoalloteichus sp. AHMU CJ021]|nr:hypothetical protein C1701_23970 [Actinoalloteichus sp. AHMU CJ021]
MPGGGGVAPMTPGGPLLGHPSRVEASAECGAWTVDLSADAFPFLADHRVGGAVVLPGAAVVEMASAAVAAATGDRPSALVDVRFERVCPLPRVGARRLRTALTSDQDGGHTASVTSGSGRRWTHATVRCAARGGTTRPLDVAGRPSCLRGMGGGTAGDGFYSGLRAAGNDYGPAFQLVRHLWRRGGEAVAAVGACHGAAEVPSWWAGPMFLDAAIQVVASAGLDGGAFVWVGCDRVSFHGAPADGDQVYARVRGGGDGGDVVVGDAVLLGPDGRRVIEVTGARLRPLRSGLATRRGTTVDPDRARVPTLAVASTFPAAPLAARLEAELAAAGVAVRVVVHPEPGTVSELTAPGGPLDSRRGDSGVLLVGPGGEEDGRAGEEEAPGRRFSLPGVGEILHLHDYETEYLYDEIFVRNAYLRHGVTLRPGDTVFDVGANIGMFTLFAHQCCPDVRVYAFEPAAPAFAALRENCARHCPGSQVFNHGISDRDQVLPFTFYRNSTVFSGFDADARRDARTIRTVVENAVRARVGSSSVDIGPIVDRLSRDRLVSSVHDVPTTSLSAVLDETGVDRVDLLKVDTEGSEVPVLGGIEDRHWGRIRQVVMEVHDGDASVVAASLRSRGFDVLVDPQEDPLRGTPLLTVFARRPDRRVDGPPPRLAAPDGIGPSRRRVSGLARAVAALRSRTGSPCVVALCPSPTATGWDGEREGARRSRSGLAAEVAAVPGTRVIGPGEVVEERRDSDGGDDDVFFAALARVVARAYLGVRGPGR